MTIFPEEYTKPITLNYFKGKVCTVLIDQLAPFQDNMTPEEATQTFTGVVNNIGGKGVCITDLTTKTRNYFFYDHIVGLREEKVLDPDNPEDQQEIALIQEAMDVKNKEVKAGVSSRGVGKGKVEQMESIGKESAFVNIADLQRLARESKS